MQQATSEAPSVIQRQPLTHKMQQFADLVAEGKKLSEAIKIMSFMKKDQHIDPDLFDLFLRAGVYREYAERFMKPELIDAVDIEAYLSPLS